MVAAVIALMIAANKHDIKNSAEEIMKDYYKILQVAPDASTEVIQMAYKALAKKYHPDLNPGQEEAAQEKMKDVNEAYEILSDKDKRWQYDQIYYRQERQSRRLLIQHQNRPRVLKHILRSRKVNKQVLRQLIRPLKIKKRHQVEKDVQRQVADVWLYLLYFSS